MNKNHVRTSYLQIKVILFLTVNAFAVHVSGGEETETKEMLLNACKFTSSASFKSLNESSKIAISRMITPDNILLERFERGRRVDLINKEGIFFWYKEDNDVPVGDTVIKISSRMSENFSKFIQVFNYYNGYGIGSYSISEETYNGIPCCRVDVIFPTDDTTLAKLTRLTLEQLNKERDAVKKRYVEVMTFWIGKEKPFIYSYAYYNLYGEKIMAIDWGMVDFVSPIDQNLFKLPEPVSVKVANDYRQLRRLEKKYYGPKPSMFKRIDSVINKIDSDDIFTWSSRILIWGSILVFAIASSIKTRKYLLARQIQTKKIKWGKYDAAKQK